MISYRHTSESIRGTRNCSFLHVIYLLILLQCSSFYAFSFAQHPDRKRISRLREELPFTQGSSRQDCLNSISEEYWWFPRPDPDSIYLYASLAHTESLQNNNAQGLARSTLNLGVSEIYKRNYPAAEAYLRQGILLSGNIQDGKSRGWSYLFLGWVLFLKNDYPNAEDAYKKATSYFQKTGEEEGLGRLCAYKSMLYTAMGDFEKGFEYCRSSLQIREKMNDHECILFSYNNLGNLYKAAGDFETALDYYRQSLKYATAHHIPDWDENEQFGTIFCRLNRFDSSFYYLKKSLRSHPGDPNIRMSLSETYLNFGEYDSALTISLPLINDLQKQQ